MQRIDRCDLVAGRRQSLPDGVVVAPGRLQHDQVRGRSKMRRQRREPGRIIGEPMRPPLVREADIKICFTYVDPGEMLGKLGCRLGRVCCVRSLRGS